MQEKTIRMHDLAGRDVVSRAESAKVGSFADALFSPSDGHIAYVFFDVGGGFAGFGGRRNAVRGEAIQAIGRDAVVIRDKSGIIDDPQHTDRTGLVSAAEVRGRSVMTDDGKEIGEVKDFIIDRETGHVISYVVGQRGGGGIHLGGGQPPAEELIIPVGDEVPVGAGLITVPSHIVKEVRSRNIE
ncbi:MAG: PRC-barrel domain-containing protein [Dehalococcoidales bacterium]|nr:PRC-barrel domain-containing protein [Dehalococcoidales bacterium]